MSQAQPARVFTIPAGLPFLTCLAEAILTGVLPVAGAAPPATLELPKMLVLLPTRRACRALQDAFLTASKGRALLLPRIRPIGEADEDASLIGGGRDGISGSGAELEVPPAMEGIERHLMLTSLVLRWIETRGAAEDEFSTVLRQTPAQASALARGLARLMDMVETEGADLADLAGLAPAEFSAQWQQTLDFMQILAAAWPAILSASGNISPAERRNRLLDMECARLAADRGGGPVIVAGVTGSIPATVRLMQTVASLPQGALVLSGLDQTLPDDAWAAVAMSPSHPQFRLAALLNKLEISRSGVSELVGSPALERFRFVAEALRPAVTTATWRTIRERIDVGLAAGALQQITRLDAGSPEEEAEAVALILRHAADDAHATAALVTPDRTLARRVAVRMASWGIAVDDSAGRPLSKTAPGVMLDLAAEAVVRDWPPAVMMALLKHPLTRLGLTVAEVRRGARMLELRTLRRPYLGRGLMGIRTMLQQSSADTVDLDDSEPHHAAISGMSSRDRELAMTVLDRLEKATATFARLRANGPYSVFDMIQAHIDMSEALATDETGSPDALWAEASGEAVATFFAKLQAVSSVPLSMPLDDYPDFYRSLIATESARQLRTTHPRLAILGPFEARLLQPDIVILGGLNDGVWPEIAEPDPWLNRPMLAALGLPQPETRIGDSAHDFVQLLGGSKVYLTRAAKLDGAPAVASRWLLRIEALLSGLGIPDALVGDPAQPWLGWAQNQKALPEHRPRPAPEPRPPLSARPRKLSVTRIEPWMANPYAIFARDILRLEPMPDLGGPPEASVRGRIIHQALHRFAAAHPEALPADVAAELIAGAEAGLTKLAAHPRVAAFWRPRFARFAEWFAETEPSRRIGLLRTASEIRGAHVLVAPGGPFRLTARADRIDTLKQGGLVITDYKTGTPPKAKRVLDGTAPQLPLEAAIAVAGGFEGIAAAPVMALRYIAAKGGEPPGAEQSITGEHVMELAAQTLAGLGRLIARFDDPATPYAALRRQSFQDSYRYDDYAHLARVAEWSLLAEADGDEQ